MLSGIESTLKQLQELIDAEPTDQDLEEALQILIELEAIAKTDQAARQQIDELCVKLYFGSASSSAVKSPNQIVVETLNALLQKLKPAQRLAPPPRKFVPSFNRAQPSVEQPSDNVINNFCNIFEDESRFGDSDLILKLIRDLGSKKGADKAPMPPLTRCAIQGGGAKGAAYAGTYKAMDMLGVTDTTKTYCGASAGAITSFMMGLGYNSEQFDAISSAMNFQDLADYNPSKFGAKAGGMVASQAYAAATQLFVHSGVAFHNWAKSQCAMVFGDPDITFIEMQEWYIARGLPAPEMVFMGTMVSPESKKVVFSARETPHIRIADAVRASMSFPIAWEQFDVKYGKSIARTDKRIRDGDIHGRYADGGILNNYPIDELNSDPENPAYQKPTCKDASGSSVQQNPSSYGFSLTSSLKGFDESKTPMTKRLHVLKQRAHGRSTAVTQNGDEDFERRTIDTQLGKSTFWNLAAVLKKNYLGDTATSDLDDRKRDVFDRQTSLIYTEGVGTLEFTLTPHKKKLIEDSGKFAFINWYIKYRNPSQTYDDFYHSKNIGQGVPYDADRFEGDSTLSKTDIEKLDLLTLEPKQVKVVQKYCRFMIDLHEEFTMLRKVIALNQDAEVLAALSEEQKQRLAQFNDINANQRLQHLSWQIKALVDKYPFLTSDKVLAINKTVFNIIRERSKQKEDTKLLRNQELDANIDKQSVIKKIHDLLAQNTPQATNIAIAIFKGQMSSMFDLMKRDPSLFGALSQRCNALQLEDLLENLRTTAHQLDQQERSWHGNFGLLRKLENETLENFAARFQMFMYNFAIPSPLEVAIAQRDKDKIQFILAHKSKLKYFIAQIPYFDPLKPNKNGKNALHICVDEKDFDTFRQIIVDTKPDNLPFAKNGQHLLHYVIEHGSAEFISQLFTNKYTVKWIKNVIQASSNSNPEFCSRFGCGETLREQIIRIAATKDFALDFKTISDVLQLKSPIHADVVKLYDPLVDSSVNQKDEQYLQGFLKKNVDPTNIPDFSPAQALRCLTLPDANSKILLELAAADESESKQHLELALKLINICKKDPLVKAKLSELYKVKFADDKTLLYLAVEHNNAAFASECLDNHSSIDDAGPFQENSSVLTCAAKRGDFAFIEKLMNSKLPYARSIADKSGKNALHYLAMNPDCPSELYCKLASKQAILTAAQYLKIDLPDSDGMTPFDYLIENNRYDIINEIMSQKTKLTWHIDDYFNIFNIRADGKTSLQYLVEKAAVDPSYKPLLQLALKSVSKSGLSVQDSNGKTVLHYLAESDKEIISAEDFNKYLLKGNQGILPTLGYETSATYQQLTNAEDNNGNSILRSIINNKRQDIIEYLQKNWKGWHLNAIFDLQSIRSDGLSDFEYLMINGNLLPEELFLTINSALPPSMQRDEEGHTKLHKLIDEPKSADKFWDMLTDGITTWSPTTFRESAKDYQVQTSLLDLENQTVLRHIIKANRFDILDMLAKKTGSKVAGMLATSGARWYLDHYFDMTLTDENGVSDLEYASKHASPEVKNTLFSRLSPDCLTHAMARNDSRGWTPLHYVASDPKINPTAFWELINRGQGQGNEIVYRERTNVEDINGNTPFRLLIDNNRMDVLKELAKHCGSSGLTLRKWWLDHYINLEVKRPDGMNDLEYLIFKAKKDPSLKAFVELVKSKTSSDPFDKASTSVERNYEQFAIQVAELEERKAAQAALEPDTDKKTRKHVLGKQ